VEGLRLPLLALAALVFAPVPGGTAAPAPDCDRLWRETRSLCEQGERASGDERKRLFKRAIEAGQQAVRQCPERVDAHYWLGASYGRYAQERGGFAAWRLVGRLRREMETVVRMQPDYEGGDAFLALGELDLRLPGLFGGNKQRGVARLEQGLRVAPHNDEIRLALAQAYARTHRQTEALALLQGIRDASTAAGRSDEVRRQAEALIETLEPGEGPRAGQHPR
jgi:hypothetical protein